MRSRRVALVVITLLAAASSAPATAWPSFNNHIPNAEAAGGCDLCHGAGLTAFGAQSKEVQVNGVSWSRLFCQDADGDGQTNGQELGDPCGHWRRGEAPPRASDLSSPSDDASTAASPDVGCDAGEASPVDCDETDIDDIGDDGCAAFGVTSGSPLGALALALVLARVRRRRSA